MIKQSRTFNFIFICCLLIFQQSCKTSDKKTTSIQEEKTLIIFHAGSLAVPFHQLADSFMKENPEIKVLLESAGSVECARKITELKKPCDLIASSDYTVIDDLLIPNYTKWYVNFATNEMIIAYTSNSKMADKIDSINWLDILLRKDIFYGRSNPDLDPCGYRSILCFKLAEHFYKKKDFAQKMTEKDRKFIRPKEVDLLALLETNTIDYIFIYRSVAIQHGLKFIKLPDEINLKLPEFSYLYKSVNVEVTGKVPDEKTIKSGEPMVYAISMLDDAPNKESALKFLEFLLSKKGKDIMENNGQPFICNTSHAYLNAIPASLKSLVKVSD